MGRPKNFLNWIFSKDKKPYYLDDNGHVLQGDVNTHLKPDGQPAHLSAAPTGWKGIEVKYGRNTTYWGVFRDFTATLTFALDGAKILRTLLFTIGFEAQAFYAMHKKDPYAWPLAYNPWYIGELDFSKSKVTYNNNTIDISVLDGSVAKYLKAFENTVYEFPIPTDPEKKIIYLDGFPFVNTVEYSVYDGQQFDGSHEFQIGLGVTTQEGTTQGIIAQDEQYTASAIVLPSENWFFKDVNKFITLKVQGSLTVDMGGSRTFPLFIKKYKIVNGISLATTYYPFDTGTYSGLTTVNFDLSIPVNPNEYCFFVGQGIIGSPGIDFTVKASTLKMSYEVTFQPTFCFGITPKRLFELLTAKMTNGLFQCSSAFLDGITDILYTSGTALRNFGDDKASIKISFSDFFRSLKGLDYKNRAGVGLGIKNDKLIIEQIGHFFQTQVIMDLGVVDNMEIDVADDLAFNTIKVGYNNQTYDNVNGLDEVNVTQNYTTDVLKVVKELDMTDPVRTDATGIELQRLTLFQQDTTDSASDNDPFKIMVSKGGTLEYYNGEFVVETGNKIRFNSLQSNVLTNGTQFTITGTAIDGTYTVQSTSLITGVVITTVEPITVGIYTGVLAYFSPDTYIPKRLTYSAISGILQPDKKYNIEFSPKTMLLNQGAFLHCFLEDESGKIHYQTGDKNSELSRTYLTGETITEKADIVVADLAPKLFLPYYASFDVDVPLTFKDLMDANPYGQVSWTYRGVKMYGYMFDGSIRPATNEHLNFKLLLAPNNDLAKLI